MKSPTWNGIAVLDKSNTDALVYLIGPDISAVNGHHTVGLREVIEAGIHALIESLPPEELEHLAEQCAADVVKQLSTAVRHEARMQHKLLGFAQDMVTFEGDPMKLISQGQMASLIGRRLLKEDPAFAEGADNNFECAFDGLARANAA